MVAHQQGFAGIPLGLSLTFVHLIGMPVDNRPVNPPLLSGLAAKAQDDNRVAIRGNNVSESGICRYSNRVTPNHTQALRVVVVGVSQLEGKAGVDPKRKARIQIQGLGQRLVLLHLLYTQPAGKIVAQRAAEIAKKPCCELVHLIERRVKEPHINAGLGPGKTVHPTFVSQV